MRCKDCFPAGKESSRQTEAEMEMSASDGCKSSGSAFSELDEEGPVAAADVQEVNSAEFRSLCAFVVPVFVLLFIPQT